MRSRPHGRARRGTCRCAGGRSDRRGVTLVEILVSMTLLVIILSSIAALSVAVSQQSNAVAVKAFGNAGLGEQVARLMVVPYDSLAARAGCDTLSANARYRYTQCVGVADLSGSQRRITVVLTPRQRAARPDTLVLDRTRAPTASPFNTP